ncbi:PA2778 family cysteine peptidase [Amphritea sp. HPY]|uniref:PA2778 family cysteine peptidase n=1 Tax=Amphritea sp. HPY TaxID=3421652 RepID=UPI003D7DEC76
MLTVLIAKQLLLLNLVAGLLLVTGCSINQSMLAQLKANPAINGSAELQGLAHFPQQYDQCGPASLATVLAFNGVQASPQQLKPHLYIPAKGGTLTVELVARARQYGLVAYALTPKLEDIFLELDAGHPVLVMQNLGLRSLPKWHFAVAIGYNLEQQQILLRSGPDIRYPTDLTLFKQTWDNADNWAQVILPPDKLPATATLPRYMQAANTLEQLDQLDSAFMAYQQAAERWPDSPAPLLGLGNISYSHQRYADAVNYFQRYIKTSPDPAPGWNNLAYALMAAGCRTSALNAINCAISLAPDQPGYNASLQELTSDTGSGNVTASCALPNCKRPL